MEKTPAFEEYIKTKMTRNFELNLKDNHPTVKNPTFNQTIVPDFAKPCFANYLASSDPLRLTQPTINSVSKPPRHLVPNRSILSNSNPRFFQPFIRPRLRYCYPSNRTPSPLPFMPVNGAFPHPQVRYHQFPPPIHYHKLSPVPHQFLSHHRSHLRPPHHLSNIHHNRTIRQYLDQLQPLRYIRPPSPHPLLLPTPSPSYLSAPSPLFTPSCSPIYCPGDDPIIAAASLRWTGTTSVMCFHIFFAGASSHSLGSHRQQTYMQRLGICA